MAVCQYNAIEKRYGIANGGKIAFIALEGANVPVDSIKAAIKQTGMLFPYVNNAEDIWKRFGITAVPKAVLIKPDKSYKVLGIDSTSAVVRSCGVSDPDSVKLLSLDTMPNIVSKLKWSVYIASGGTVDTTGGLIKNGVLSITMGHSGAKNSGEIIATPQTDNSVTAFRITYKSNNHSVLTLMRPRDTEVPFGNTFVIHLPASPDWRSSTIRLDTIEMAHLSPLSFQYFSPFKLSTITSWSIGNIAGVTKLDLSIKEFRLLRGSTTVAEIPKLINSNQESVSLRWMSSNSLGIVSKTGGVFAISVYDARGKCVSKELPVNCQAGVMTNVVVPHSFGAGLFFVRIVDSQGNTISRICTK